MKMLMEQVRELNKLLEENRIASTDIIAHTLKISKRDTLSFAEQERSLLIELLKYYQSIEHYSPEEQNKAMATAILTYTSIRTQAMLDVKQQFESTEAELDLAIKVESSGKEYTSFLH